MTATIVQEQTATTEGDTGSRGRRIAFRVVVALMAIVVAPLMLFGLSELLFMWLPGETVLGIVDDPTLSVADIELHRTHFLATGIVAAAYLPSLLVQVRRPQRHVAGMSLLLAIPVLGAVLYGITGSFAAWVSEELVMLVPVVLLAVLHPRSRELFRPLRFDRAMGVLAAAAAVPWLGRVWSSVVLQVQEVPGDSHAAMEHWATAALAASAIIVAATLGASHRDGWRVPAGVAVVGTVVAATHAIVFPDVASSLHPVAAIAALAWSALYASAAVARHGRRGADTAEDRTPQSSART